MDFSKAVALIAVLPQANVQAALFEVLDLIKELNEKPCTSKLELETLEVENDYVQQNLREEEDAETEGNTEQTESDASDEVGERE